MSYLKYDIHVSLFLGNCFVYCSIFETSLMNFKDLQVWWPKSRFGNTKKTSESEVKSHNAIVVRKWTSKIKVLDHRGQKSWMSNSWNELHEYNFKDQTSQTISKITFQKPKLTRKMRGVGFERRSSRSDHQNSMFETWFMKFKDFQVWWPKITAR